MLHLKVTDLHCNGGSNISIEIICLKSIFCLVDYILSIMLSQILFKNNCQNIKNTEIKSILNLQK